MKHFIMCSRTAWCLHAGLTCGSFLQWRKLLKLFKVMHENCLKLICIMSFFFSSSGPITRTLRFPWQAGNTMARGRESLRQKGRAVRTVERRTSARTATWTKPRPCERPEVKPKAARRLASAVEPVQQKLRKQVRKCRGRSFCNSLPHYRISQHSLVSLLLWS